MQQQYRELEVGEWTQWGDEVLVQKQRGGEIIAWPALVDDYCFGRYRRPPVAEDSQIAEPKKEREDVQQEIIVDLARRLEDALSDKVIAETSLRDT